MSSGGDHMAFLGLLNTGGEITDGNSYGIWSYKNGGLELIVRSGDHALGTAPDNLLAGMGGMLRLNSVGQVVFTGA